MTNDRPSRSQLTLVALTTLLLTGALILARLRAAATFLVLLLAAFILTWLVADLTLTRLLLTGLLSFLILLILLVTILLSLLIALILIGHEAPRENRPSKLGRWMV